MVREKHKETKNMVNAYEKEINEIKDIFYEY